MKESKTIALKDADFSPIKEIKTINLKGKEYAPVNERVRMLHHDNGNCSIVTDTVILSDTMVMTKATIIPDVQNPERKFTGSAIGQIGREKAFEKLETVAVGRALAFAGYLVDGSIASYEEMERFVDNTEPTLTKQLFKPFYGNGNLTNKGKKALAALKAKETDWEKIESYYQVNPDDKKALEDLVNE